MGRREDEDFNQELDSHLEMMTEDLVRSGMSPQEARRAARVQLGGVAQLSEAHRAVRGWPVIEAFAQDVRYALRSMAKSPGFTAMAVLTLAIGIGVNTAVFTLFNATALRPVQAVGPHRLMQVTRTTKDALFSSPDYVYYRDHQHAFSGMAAMANHVFSMSGVSPAEATPEGGIAGAAGLQFPRVLATGTEPISATLVSGNYFDVLGVRAARGRTFLAEDDAAGAEPVVLISDNFRERRFGRDAEVLGRKIILNDVRVTVIGVTARDFRGTWMMVPDFWVPLSLKSQLVKGQDALGAEDLCCRLYGRLRPQSSPGQVAGELEALRGQLRAEPAGQREQFFVGEATAGGQPSQNADVAGPLLLLGAIGLVLLIACANVASLLLARSAARQREISIRLAIGASRGRLIRQLLTENALMSWMAGVAGVVLSWWSLHLLMSQVAGLPIGAAGTLVLDVSPDLRVLGYVLFLSIAATFGFGLAPALESSRPNLSSGLKDEGAAFGGKLRKSRLRDLMVGVQAAVCLVLLIAAGLLARASQRTMEIDLGFDYRNIVSLDVVFPQTMPLAAIAATRGQLARELEALPEIQSVAVTSHLPLVHGGVNTIPVSVHGVAMKDPMFGESVYTLVTPNYFDTMGIAIVRGRNFTEKEAQGFRYNGGPVVLSEATAKRFWPGEDPLGKQLELGPVASVDNPAPHMVAAYVIGVAKDVRSVRLERMDFTALYFPVTRAFGGNPNGNNGRSPGTIAMRARSDETRAVAAVQRALQSTHPGLQAVVGDSRTAFTTQTWFVASRMGAIAATIIGLLGLLMASVGIHGTVAFAVAQRTQEIGIRMALGAARGSVLRLMLGETMRPVAVGLAVGFALAAGVAQAMHSLLFGLGRLDPVAFLGASGFLAAVALGAAYLPARKATRVDPMVALRYE